MQRCTLGTRVHVSAHTVFVFSNPLAKSDCDNFACLPPSLSHTQFPAALGDMNVILRHYQPAFPVEFEFRCFVHDGRLTAIAQYHCYDVFPVLQDHALLIRVGASIAHFHQLIAPAVSLACPSYVLDVIVCTDVPVRVAGGADDLFACVVVALNPFGGHLSSGAALFDWERDADLLHGRTDPGPAASVRVDAAVSIKPSQCVMRVRRA